MTVKLGPHLALEKVAGRTRVEGRTCSGTPSHGTRTDWRLSVDGRSDLVVGDTSWDNGERDVVLVRPPQVPPLPGPLSTLLERRRGTVDSRGHRLLMAVGVVEPGDAGWPRLTWPGVDALIDVCGRDYYEAVFDHGVTQLDTRAVILGDESRHRTRLCALLDPSDDVATAALYVVTRVVPTLKDDSVGWL